MPKTDPLTRLPALPDNYFWRVARPVYSDWTINFDLYTYTKKEELEISLVSTAYETVPGGWFRAEKTVTRALYTEAVQGTKPVAVLGAANRIMKKWALDKERSELVGDYPPKRLGE